MSPQNRDILVGIDVGGSKTHIRVECADGNGRLVDHVHSSTGWAGLTDRERADALATLVEETVANRGRAVGVVAGVHGNDSPEQEVVLRQPLASRYPIVQVLNDSHLLILAFGKDSGTGVIAGTGSSATATMKGHSAITVGGWGWVLGDEGGAVGLVRDAARQVLDAYDRIEDDPLTTLLLTALDVDHPHALQHMLSTTEPRLWAKAAIEVFNAERAGSERARRVIHTHARAMAEMVRLLQARGGDTDTVVCAGGVIANQAVLFAAFETQLRALLGSSIEIALLRDPPVTGAINLARSLYQQAAAVNAYRDDNNERE